MKGYKAFEKGMICRGKQYTENTVFEEENAEICKSGMHFVSEDCPLEVLEYYNLVDKNGNEAEFAEVEALDEPVTDDRKKYCSKKLKIGGKISFAKLVQAAVDINYAKASSKGEQSSGDESRLASSGDRSRLTSSGDESHLTSSGRWSYLTSSGRWSYLTSSGRWSYLTSSGDESHLASSGDESHLTSSGRWSYLTSSGDESHLTSSGRWSFLTSSGDRSRLASSGRWSRLTSCGDRSRLTSSGDESRLASSGKNSVICCAGHNCQAKAKKDSWITLAEWDYSGEKPIPVCVKTEKVDGEKIKADTFYTLKNGEFVEVTDN